MFIRIGTFGATIAAFAMVAGSSAAHAQFRGLFNDARRGAQAAEGCESDEKGDAARGIIGGLLGGAARRTASRAGLGSFVPLSEFSNELTKEIACKLNEQEQEQAANATLEATRGASEDTLPEVGQSASWTSATRSDVSGTSTITAREEIGGDGEGSLDCIMVTDVIIVEGEETRADKRMCRPPGSARYSIVA
ncbi:MAG: hypothetical protein V2I27_14710 [Erythrobacter sp.]|nr:hypothetical protein [Erythrobacter sp.]